MLNICLIGCGGIGTIASLVLEKSKRAKVTAVLRSNYDLVLEKGLDIDSIDHGKLVGWKPSASKYPSPVYLPSSHESKLCEALRTPSKGDHTIMLSSA